MTTRTPVTQVVLRLLAIGATVLWSSGTSCTQIAKDAYTDSVYSAQDLSQPSQPQLLIQSGHNNWVNSVAFSPDGKRLASVGDRDKNIKLWEVSSGRLLRDIEWHSHKIKSIAFSPDGKMLAAGEEYGNIVLWEVSSGRLLHSLEGHIGSGSIAFSPDGKMLYVKHTKIWMRIHPDCGNG